MLVCVLFFFFFSSRRRHTRCALVTGVQTCCSSDVAFARLLVRDVRVVVLDEATARMDPLTEMRVVAAADRLLTGRTGILIAHRLSTIERAPLVAVLDHGTVVQPGARSPLAPEPGPFRDRLPASRPPHGLRG